ncbi:hypothetical protein MUB18_20640 [Sphingobacterium sp. PCS056]|uniref:hypothetical protein n=1 Tax=Sphingobacterium sp. PCS056 TaxID=2931400 RepID=UPI00200F2439|nr:hypothetical protein [Sphingobacterium sp. PCS056]UPZ36497.1 hypothetical protein MUB18_20640 [Sphingobacterium sp. PCS056]
MEEISNTLFSELNNAIQILEVAKNFKHIIIPEYDCSRLPEIGTNGKNLPENLKHEFFSHLHQFDQVDGNINDFPCIYAFELIDILDGDRVLQAFTQVDKVLIQRTIPALKSQPPKDSKYLYLGKVETAVGNRLVTHLGYYVQPGNHGLQLAYWMKDILPAIKIRVHIFRFEKKFKPYLTAFEVIMAKELKPIIGKH